MQKDFENWHKLKKEIHVKIDVPEFREQQIWWCSFGQNIGFEEDGKSDLFSRPVLVLKKFNKSMFIGIPLSTTKKEGKYHFRFLFLDGCSTALLSQIRTFDSKRLVRKMGSIDQAMFDEIRTRMKELL